MPKTRLEILGVGPQKTATSWLAEVLAPTEALCFPSGVKETFFWDRYFDRGIDWYMAHFKGHGRRIEFGPTYFHSADAIERLQFHNPELRIIITLRDPVARSWSLYLHHRRKGRIGCSFEEAVVQIPEILQASRYHLHMPRWYEAFGKERVLVLFQDDIEADPAVTLDRVGDFIGESLETDCLDLKKRVNEASQPPSYFLAAMATNAVTFLRSLGLYRLVDIGKAIGMKTVVYGYTNGVQALPEGLRRKLSHEFEPDIVFVENLMSVNLDHWRYD